MILAHLTYGPHLHTEYIGLLIIAAVLAVGWLKHNRKEG